MKSTGKILLVEDTKSTIDLINTVLTSQGYKVAVAINGREALPAALKWKPSLILMDIMMPEMDGYEACCMLKENEITRDIPVIFLSAMIKSFDKVKAFQIGAVDFLSKPVDSDELLARVETHLSLRRFQKELEEKNKTLENTLEKLENTQNQLVQSEKMAALGVLTAGIAHEINNPINFISSGAECLERDFQDLLHILNKLKEIPEDKDALEERVDIIRQLVEKHAFDEIVQIIPQTIKDIKEGVYRTAEIIKGLLLYSRSNKSELLMADIHEGIDASLVLLRDKYKDSIEIIKNYDYSIEEIQCFPGQLSQVFTNLIDNAIDAIDSKGTITITTLLKTNKVVISIRDTGKSIPSDILDKLFDPFFTTKAVGKGTGLGLSICKGIIDNHKGILDVKSVLGKGSEFIITLPSNLK